MFREKCELIQGKPRGKVTRKLMLLARRNNNDQKETIPKRDAPEFRESTDTSTVSKHWLTGTSKWGALTKTEIESGIQEL